jgi:hypothetical protein
LLTPLGLSPSFGFGDWLGLATPGHIAAVRGSKFAPIFAQQSVRENQRTGRTPLQVLEDARGAVEALGWELPWGADADHLKSVNDLPPFVEAGYTFYTVDPGAQVDNAADTDSLRRLQEKARGAELGRLTDSYLRPAGHQPWGGFYLESLLRAEVKYGRAIRHAAGIYRRLCQMKDTFDFELSVDETDAPTTPLEHYFIASELTQLGVHFTSLAPRFIGRFEKGVDYIGNLQALDAELSRHAAVMAHFGTYKLSLHSGSDKFSVYPLIAQHWGERLHVKTAGTSYLEALRLLARVEPALFERIWKLARERYPQERLSYHVSAQIESVPAGLALPDLLEDFQAREILHVTFGSALAQFGTEIKTALASHAEEYQAGLEKHFRKHLDLLH